MAWDVELAETIGKVIPNEASKLSGWLRYIPYIGQAAQVIGAVDAGATGYADSYDAMKDEGASSSEARKQAFRNAIAGAQTSASGGSDPGWYGSGGDINADWANKIGSTNPSMFMGGWGGLGSMYSKGSRAVDYWGNEDNMGYDPALAGTQYANPQTGAYAPQIPYDPYVGNGLNYGNNNVSYSSYWA